MLEADYPEDLTNLKFSQCWLYGNGVYTGTKYAVKGIAECLRLELTPYNMRVSLVCPGFVDTGLLDDGESTKNRQTALILQPSFLSHLLAVVGLLSACIIFKSMKDGRFDLKLKLF